MERQVRHRLGEDTPELLYYRKNYEREFKKKWAAVTKEFLWERMAQSKVVLVGDFHALHQSQKAQARLLRHIPEGRKILLGVEFFEAADQEKIDGFLSGRLSEPEFLKAVQWSEKWGFPWEHYRPLLRWAQKKKVRVVGLNKSYKSKRSPTGATLKSRDRFAGRLIANLVQENPDHLIFVIYGDLHLAQSHIPHEIENILGKSFSKKILRIFQNSEQIYFQLLQQELESSTELVQLSANSFCLMSVPPWVKWQNYLMFLEQAYDLDLADDEDDEGEDDFIDYTDHVGRYVKIISEELGAGVSASGLSVYTAQDSSFWEQVRRTYDTKKRLWIETMIAEEISFYLPEIRGAYLARATVNHAASLAMRYIHSQMNQSSRILSDVPGDFLGLIWEEGAAYFGSKIINHKRKADTIADLKASLSARGPSDLGKESLQLALAQKMHEMMVIAAAPRQRLQNRSRRKESYLLAASLLGGMLGERLFSGYRKRLVPPPTVLIFLTKQVENPNFEIAYYDIVELIESLPAPFHSKKEKL